MIGVLKGVVAALGALVVGCSSMAAGPLSGARSVPDGWRVARTSVASFAYPPAWVVRTDGLLVTAAAERPVGSARPSASLERRPRAAEGFVGATAGRLASLRSAGSDRSPVRREQVHIPHARQAVLYRTEATFGTAPGVGAVRYTTVELDVELEDGTLIFFSAMVIPAGLQNIDALLDTFRLES